MARKIVVTLDDRGAIESLEELGQEAQKSGKKLDDLGLRVEDLSERLDKQNKKTTGLGSVVGDLTKRFLTFEVAKRALSFAAGELNEQWNKLAEDSGPQFANMLDRVYNGIRTFTIGIDQAAVEHLAGKLDKQVEVSKQKILELEKAIQSANDALVKVAGSLEVNRWKEHERAIYSGIQSLERITEEEERLKEAALRAAEAMEAQAGDAEELAIRLQLLAERRQQIQNEQQKQLEEEEAQRERLVDLIKGSELPAREAELESIEEVNAAIEKTKQHREQLLDISRRLHEDGNLGAEKAVELQGELNEVTQEYNNLLNQQAQLQRQAAAAEEEKARSIAESVQQANENLAKKFDAQMKREQEAMEDLAADIERQMNATRDNTRATQDNTRAMTGDSGVVRSGAPQGATFGGPGAELFGRAMSNINNAAGAFGGGGDGVMQQGINPFLAEMQGFNQNVIGAFGQAVDVVAQQRMQLEQLVQQLARIEGARMGAIQGAAGRLFQENGGRRAARGRFGP